MAEARPLNIVVTGARGLLGWHAAARLHATNSAARFRGDPAPYALHMLDHAAFQDDGQLYAAVEHAGCILHFAGVNRASDAEIEQANPAIAQRLVDACRRSGKTPHVVYADTIHRDRDTAYGRSKRRAADVLSGLGAGFTDIIYPHIFGECARPRYNNVTATLIDVLLKGEQPELSPDGQVELLHAGAAAQLAIDAAVSGQSAEVRPEGRKLSIPALFDALKAIHGAYSDDLFPALSDDFTLQLFNSYRAATYPGGWPRALQLRSDARGTLFETAKGGGGGQTFLSWTHPGVTRGDHFHLEKVERFVVLQGEAVIRIRRVLTDELVEFSVSGKTPVAVDMPTLHTHSIENVGTEPLLTLFWAHEVFDPSNPDTFADKVLS